MSDVRIAYKGAAIAELNGPGTQTLKTAGTYCEGDIEVAYAPRSRTYDLTLAKASGWVLLTTLDEDVLAHIDDPALVVSLVNLSGFLYENYSTPIVIASNTAVAQQTANKYPQYGTALRQGSETSASVLPIYYEPSKRDTAAALGGALFRLDGDKYYFKPADGFVRSGTYTLTFTW